MRDLRGTLFLIIGLLAPTFVYAQNGAISGKVSDAANAAALNGAQVEVVRETGAVAASVLTDEQGLYRFANVPPGTYHVSVNLLGYGTQTSDPFQLRAGESRSIPVTLSSRTFELNPVVVTASRRKEKALEAPAAVSVVTREQIADRATMTPVDHLRSVPGVDIITQGITATNVVARGFNNIFSTTLHVLTDYRIASIPSLRVNLLHFIPANNDDIERIEVVLGPGSALYGPNTSGGVLHILTRSPLDQQGTSMSVAGGNRSIFQGSFRTSQLITSNLGVKISGQYMQGKEWPFTDPVEFVARAQALAFDPNTKIGLRDYDTKRWSTEGRADWRVTPTTTAVLQAGYTLSANGVELTGIGAGQTVNWSYSYLQARVSHNRFFAQAYVNGSNSGQTYLIRNGLNIIDDSKAVVAQIQDGLSIGTRQSFTYGLDVVETLPDTHGTINGKNENDDNTTEAGAYVQSETALSKKFNLVLAGRVDHHSRLEHKAIFSPRAALVFNPNPNHSFRATFNQAFSTPVSFNLFLDLDAGLAPGPLGEVLGYRIRAMGTEPNGFHFQNADGSLAGMRSPFAAAIGKQPGDMLPVNSATLWQLGLAALVKVGRLDATTAGILGQQHPTDAQIPIDLLNPATQLVSPLLNTKVPDVPRSQESRNSTFEVGYKGIMNDHFLLSADAWYEHESNFTSPLTPFTPLIELDSAGIYNVALKALTQAGLGNAQAQAQAAALAGGLHGVPIGVATSPEVSTDMNSAYIVASYRNFGAVGLFGADVSATAVINDAWSVSMDGSVVSKDHFFAESIPIGLNAPKLKGSISLDYRNRQKGINGEVRARYTAEFPVLSAPYSATACITDASIQALPGFADPCIKAATLVDFNAGYRLPTFGHPQLQLTVTNVLDTPYASFVGVPAIGRMVLLRLRFEF
jgi:outer membrane receptor for ferrienterochelin and colicins